MRKGPSRVRRNVCLALVTSNPSRESSTKKERRESEENEDANVLVEMER
jgi:hypothetical protein